MGTRLAGEPLEQRRMLSLTFSVHAINTAGAIDTSKETAGVVNLTGVGQSVMVGIFADITTGTAAQDGLSIVEGSLQAGSASSVIGDLSLLPQGTITTLVANGGSTGQPAGSTNEDSVQSGNPSANFDPFNGNSSASGTLQNLTGAGLGIDVGTATNNNGDNGNFVAISTALAKGNHFLIGVYKYTLTNVTHTGDDKIQFLAANLGDGVNGDPIWREANVSKNHFGGTVISATGTGGGVGSGLTIHLTATATPTVTSPTSSGITQTTAVLGGNLTATGGATITARGVVYALTSVNSNPQIGGAGVTVVTDGSTATGVFTENVSGLTGNSSYSYVAYATNSVGTTYTTPVSTFTTAASSTAPVVTSPTSASITATTATLGGNLTSTGGGTITARGVVYSLTSANSNPTLGGTGVTNVMDGSTATGVFTENVTGLTPGAAYSYVAYATNSVGTTYTSPVSTFNALANLPTVTTPTSASITATTATLGGNLTATGGGTITARGVVYSLTSANSNPTLGGTGVTNVMDGSTATGVFTENVTGLTPGAAYSFAAYATNSVGTTYTSPVSTFNALANLPTVTTPASASITSTTATLGGNLTATGGGTITARGVVYSLTSANSNPTLGGTGVTNVMDGSTTTGVFTESVTGLTPGGAYSFVAYATNSVGTTYTSPVSTFNTLANLPTVTTPTSASITSTTVTLGGNLTATGGSTITARGVVYALTSVNSNPTIGGTGVINAIDGATNTSVFSESIAGLTPGAIYSFTAYATNDAGTTYTTPISTFSTLAVAPTIASPTAVGITSASATLGANVTSNGGAALTKRGILYSQTATNANPQLGGNGVTEVDDAVAATGVFTESITGLLQATGYSYVAFATNSIGTTYTTPVSTFATSIAPQTVTSIATSGLGITAGVGDLHAGQTIKFTVTFSGTVTLNSTSGLPTLALNNGGLATYSGGSGSSALTFSYTVATGQNASDLTVTSLNLNGATISGAGGVNADLTGAATNPAGILQVDTISPTVVITRAGNANQIPGSVLQFSATFSESVSGVDTSGFSLNATGVSGASIISVDPGSDAAHYTVNVASGTGNGTIELDIIGAKIKDLAGNGLGGGTFGVTSNIASSTSPRSVAVADVTGDGIPDLIVAASSTAHAVSVFPGRGDGTYGTATVFSGGGGPADLVLADVNGDGNLDVVLINLSSSSVTVMMGSGTGSFGAPQNLAVNGTMAGIAVGDINQDGKPDIVVTNDINKTVSILLGQGDGTFQTFTTVTVGSGPNGVAIYDITGDGKPDILVADTLANGSGLVRVLPGNGDGTFGAASTFSTGGNSPGQLLVSDVNGDGKADVIVADGFNRRDEVLLGNGNGTFGSAIFASTGSANFSTYRIAIADFNGDGKPDLLTSDQVDNQVFVQFGIGNGTFIAPTSLPAGAYTGGVAASDLNGDGRPDIVATNTNGNTVSIILNGASTQTGPTFTLTASAPTVTSPTVADIGSITATLGGNVTSNGGAALIKRGVVYSITSVNANPQIGGSGVTEVDDASAVTGAFLDAVSGLLPGTGYSFAAFSTNSVGTTYTTPASTFSTTAVAPTVTTPTSASITATTATLGGNLTATGGGTITARGVVYALTSVNSNPTIGGTGVINVIDAATTTGVFSESIAGLTPGAIYSFVAYATNVAGTTYTTPASTFSTLAVAPTIASPTAVGITSASATLGANITSNGGTAITKRGILYSQTATNANPQLGGNGVTEVDDAVAATGVFTESITGLLQATGYSYVAFATNSIGTTYTTPVSTFATSTAPQTVTSIATSGLGITAGVGDLHAGQTIKFTVTFSGTVTLNSTSGLPTLALNNGGLATYSGGSGSSALTFSYIVATGQNTSDLTVTSLNLNGATISGAGGVNADLTGAATNPAGILQVDTIAPTVVITRVGNANQIPGSVLQFSVTFSEPVNGVDTSGFSLTTTGVSGASIASVTQGSDAAHYTVNIASGTGNGTIELDITGAKVNDLAGNGFGGGAFGLATNITTSSSPFAVTVADVTADGIPDLVVANINGSHNIATLPGKGDGTFGAAKTTATGSSGPQQLILADFNADGKLDVVMSNILSNVVTVMLGNGNGTFGAVQNYSVPGASSQYSLAVGDVNRDGKLDIVVTLVGQAAVVLLLGNGDGTFQSGITIPVGQFPHTVAIADVNNDGKPDLLVGDAYPSSGNNVLSVLLGNGDGTFGSATHFQLNGFPPNQLILADFNGDGKLDVAGADSAGMRVDVLLGNGNGTFGPVSYAAVGNASFSVAVADFNGDNKLDLLTGNYSNNNASVLFGTGSGSFGAATAYATGAYTEGVAAGDLNSDGRPDIVAANTNANTVSVILNNAVKQTGPTFTLTAMAPTVTSPTVTGIDSITATLGGNVTSNGGAALTKRGILYSVTTSNSNPQLGGSGVTEVDDASTAPGVFTESLSNLLIGTGYSFVAFATNSVGTTYTPVTTFTTVNVAVAPSVTTLPATNPTQNTVTLNGNVSASNGAAISNRGIIYALTSVTSNPQIGGGGVTEVDDPAATVGPFSANITGLTAGASYSFVAFATNSAGTNYGLPVLTFTAAPAVVPTVTTPAASLVGATSVTLGGNVTSSGGVALTVRGVLYSVTSLNSNPQIGGSGVTEVDDANATAGSFTESISGLSPGTAYTFVAFAANVVGTTYTSVSTFTTLTLAPSVTSAAATNINFAGVTLGGNVTSDGGVSLTKRGVLYSLTAANANPQLGGSGVTEVDDASAVIGPFTENVSGLTFITNYSFVAFATNSVGTTYTSPVSTFTTLVSPPIVVSPTVNGITANSVSLGGNVTSNGGATLTKRGVLYSITAVNPNPQLGGVGVVESDISNLNIGGYVIGLGGLSASTNYSFVAFASNSAGTSYTSPVVNFTTLGPSAPVVSSINATGITSGSATLGSNVTSNGGVTLSKRGILYSVTAINANPQLGGNGVVEIDDATTGIGTYTRTLTGLAANTTYTFVAFAVSSLGTTYSTPVAGFTTLAATVPTVTASSALGISSTGASISGNISNAGGLPLTKRGMLYSLTAVNPNPQLMGNGVTEVDIAGTDVSGIGAGLGGLAPGASYSYVAFATNGMGTAYSTPVLTFTTLPGVPTVSTPTSANVTTTSVTLGGNVVSAGGAALTKRGILYSAVTTNSNPRIGGTGVTEIDDVNATSGIFTENVTGLTAANTYAFVAFATSSIGTSYTATTYVTTLPNLPSVTSPTASSITSATATLGGFVISNGGGSLTKRGILYSVSATNSNPHIGGTGVVQVNDGGTATGTFVDGVSGLSPNTSYSFVAFATNASGTAYSAAATFATQPAAPTVASLTATSITATGAVVGGNVTTNGGAAITKRGILYSATASNSNPQLGGNGVIEVDDAGTITGVFNTSITGLTPGTAYSFVAFATNSAGTTYGMPDSTFTTLAVAPTVTAPTLTNIATTTATLGGIVTNDGGAALTKRGILYSPTASNANPQLSGNGVTEIDDTTVTTGAFTESVTGLSPGVDYSFVAFATNSVGTTYSTPVSMFATVNVAPLSVTLQSVTPNLIASALDQLTISFSQAVTGFGLANLQLIRSGSNNLLSQSQTLTSTDGGINWILGNLSGITGVSGNYTLTLSPSGISGLSGNALPVGGSMSWGTDVVPPTSNVSALPQRELAATFVVSASGSDPAPGSGIQRYDLYVSTNGGPFSLWTSVTANNPSAPFTGVNGNTYAFYSRATDYAGNVEAIHASADTITNVLLAQVSGRRVFYNNSVFDGYNPATNAADDQAIASDKSALLPGQSATFANYTNFSRGLNRLMVAIRNPANAVGLSASDFQFKVGNSNDPNTWTSAPVPTKILVRPGAGSGGSVRVAITWADYAIQNQWLQVTVLPTTNTGLTNPDVFYFGNAIGEIGNSSTDAAVTAADSLGIRGKISAASVAIDNRWDINRDGVVSTADMQIAQQYTTGGSGVLNLISVPSLKSVTPVSGHLPGNSALGFVSAVSVIPAKFLPASKTSTTVAATLAPSVLTVQRTPANGFPRPNVASASLAGAASFQRNAARSNFVETLPQAATGAFPQATMAVATSTQRLTPMLFVDNAIVTSHLLSAGESESPPMPSRLDSYFEMLASASQDVLSHGFPVPVTAPGKKKPDRQSQTADGASDGTEASITNDVLRKVFAGNDFS